MNQFVVERDNLNAALTRVKEASPTKSTIPILGNVLLRAEDGKLELTCTNLDMTISQSVAIDGPDSKIETTLPASMFAAMVNRMTAGADITIKPDHEPHSLLVTCGRTEAILPTLPGTDFPLMDAIQGGNSFTLPAHDLATLLEKSCTSISDEETRYYLGGIFLHVDNDRLAAVSTNGHHLSFYALDYLPDGAQDMPGVIVPRKTVPILQKLAKATEKEIVVSVTDTRIVAECGNIAITSKLVDGNFPEYTRVIPRDEKCIVRLNTNAITNAVQTLNTIAVEREPSVEIVLEDEAVTLSLSTNDGAAAKNTQPCSYTKGEAGETLKMNSQYLHELLKSTGSPEINIHVSDAASPYKLTINESTHVMVLMPRRV